MKVLMFGGMAVSVLALGFLTFIGPWPTYSDGFEGKAYFTNAVAAIDANAKESEITASPGRL